jgi:hypothetical protein
MLREFRIFAREVGIAFEGPAQVNPVLQRMGLWREWGIRISLNAQPDHNQFLGLQSHGFVLWLGGNLQAIYRGFINFSFRYDAYFVKRLKKKAGKENGAV